MAKIDEEKAVDVKKEEIKKDLEANKELWDFYKEYREQDVQKLIESYALDKARLQVHGNYTQKHHEYVLKEWKERAWFALAEIQHKKLFDLQCRWRAKEVEVRGFQTTFEFAEPPVPILDLDVISPISEEEIEEYIHFLNTPNGIARHYYSLSHYQDYEDLKKAHEELGQMPDYYEFHYTVKGNTGLLSLPNIKGKEEQRLIDLAIDFFKKRSKKKVAEADAKPKKPIKKGLSYHTDEVKIALANFLGDKDVAGFIKDLSKWVTEKPELEIQWAMEYLSFCYPEPVPMPAAPKWQEAIENAALSHITQKVAEILPSIHEEYLLKKQLGSPIGYIEREPQRKNKPFSMLWMEIAQKLEQGEEVDLQQFYSDKSW